MRVEGMGEANTREDRDHNIVDQEETLIQTSARLQASKVAEEVVHDPHQGLYGQKFC